MKSTPYIGYGNETLRNQPDAKEGDPVQCERCKGRHTLYHPKDDRTRKKVLWMLWYDCGNISLMAGVNGKSIMNRKPDISGQLPSNQLKVE